MLQDIILSRHFPLDINILRSEIRVSHRVMGRTFLLRFIPDHSVGAELGVFTGLFSSVLARRKEISRVTFVDPWWKAFGDTYPDWGAYTDHGRIRTRSAYETAQRRIFSTGLPNRVVEVALSCDWLEGQPDGSLDWVYLDSTHSYEGTRQELIILERKLNQTGLILGDDWKMNRNDHHHGVCLAVNEFLKTSNFEIVLCGKRGQWILRRSASRKPAADARII